MELNVPVDTLKTIEQNFMQRGGVERCLAETLEWLYNNTPGDLTWGIICTALHATGEAVQAMKLTKERGKIYLHYGLILILYWRAPHLRDCIAEVCL